ncbi:hypothetical protein KO516_12120 [Citreicella sp. C3M06]|uniref:hypothetical protein n=1 Tax=Citreicella sp. C3M06 TaxID=2841564 RepID=UPI001C0A2CCE|nr:hypothetical protein [Citreicella sp. C3M06]MBU2961552.1 hypothetical protein [Citreicella sp. C3M06]
MSLPTPLTAALAAIVLVAAPLAHADSPALSSQGNQRAQPMPASGPAGQIWISPEGCAYSRAQAPGYAPTWHLILNGHLAGGVAAKRSCPGMIGDITPG